MTGNRYHVVEIDSGRSILLVECRVLLTHRDKGTIFTAGQAHRWMQEHPERQCVAVAIESEVAA